MGITLVNPTQKNFSLQNRGSFYLSCQVTQFLHLQSWQWVARYTLNGVVLTSIGTVALQVVEGAGLQCIPIELVGEGEYFGEIKVTAYCWQLRAGHTSINLLPRNVMLINIHSLGLSILL